MSARAGWRRHPACPCSHWTMPRELPVSHLGDGGSAELVRGAAWSLPGARVKETPGRPPLLSVAPAPARGETSRERSAGEFGGGAAPEQTRLPAAGRPWHSCCLLVCSEGE